MTDNGGAVPLADAVHTATVRYGAAQEAAISACDELEALTVLAVAERLSEPRAADPGSPSMRELDRRLMEAGGPHGLSEHDRLWLGVVEAAAEVASDVAGCDYMAREHDGDHVRDRAERGATWLEYGLVNDGAEPVFSKVRFGVVVCIHRSHEDIDNRFEALRGAMVVGYDGSVHWGAPPTWTKEAKEWVTGAAQRAGVDVAALDHRRLTEGFGSGVGDLTTATHESMEAEL